MFKTSGFAFEHPVVPGQKRALLQPGKENSAAQKGKPDIESESENINDESSETTPSYEAKRLKKGDLNKHVASVHKGKKPFKCDICDYRSSEKGHIKIHVATVHGGKKSFKCNICDKSFSLKKYMTRHVAAVHERKKAIQMQHL